MSDEVKFKHGQIVQKVTGDYTFIGTIVGLVQKTSGEYRYNVEDGRGCVHIFHENQLAPFDNELRLQSQDDIVAKIERILVMNSSPTKAYGGFHDGQAGYILYERDGIPHVIPQLLALFTGHDLVKEKDRRIAELQKMIEQETIKRRAAETVLNEEVAKKRAAQDALEIAGRKLLQYEAQHQAAVKHFDPRKSVSNAKMQETDPFGHAKMQAEPQRYCSHEDETKLTDFRPRDL